MRYCLHASLHSPEFLCAMAVPDLFITIEYNFMLLPIWLLMKEVIECQENIKLQQAAASQGRG